MKQDFRKIIGRIIFFGSILLILYAFFNSIIIDKILRIKGKCTQAHIFEETLGGKTRQAFRYNFLLEGKTYNGLAKEDGHLKIGDSICIVYMEMFPSKNRPLSYFDTGKIKCNCNR